MSEQANILIVDDRPENLLSLERVLQRNELRIIRASSGNEALAALLEKDFACVLLDVQMPDMDGFETAELIRSDESTAALPIIFVTAYSKEKSAILRGYHIGAVDYITKPFDPEMVRSKVDFFVRLFRQRKMIERQAQELEEMNSQLEAANNELKNFAAVVAHDIKSPVTTMSALSMYLEQIMPRPNELTKHYMSRIVAVAHHVTQLVDDLLEYASLGRNSLRVEDIDLGLLVEKIVDINETRFAEAGAKIDCRDLPVVQGDATLIYTLVQNLILNAVKFHRNGVAPEICVRTEDDERYWHVVVEDNGEGIPGDQLRAIFEPFKRLQRSQHFDGRGIGLAICEKVALLHGGRIWAESTEGVGSRFHFTLKCEASAKKASAAEPSFDDHKLAEGAAGISSTRPQL